VLEATLTFSVSVKLDVIDPSNPMSDRRCQEKVVLGLYRERRADLREEDKSAGG
jgi:hypothetical protein